MKEESDSRGELHKCKLQSGSKNDRAALLAIALIELSPEALICSLTGAQFSWAEVLGVSPHADSRGPSRHDPASCARSPDEGSTTKQIVRINKAYEDARESSFRTKRTTILRGKRQGETPRTAERGYDGAMPTP